MNTVATMPGMWWPLSWLISVLMAMPRNEMAMAAAIDISRGRRPRRSMKKSEAAVANM